MSATQLALKRCSKCGEEKPLGQFSKQKASKDGLRSDCKACNAAYQKTAGAKAARKRYRKTESGKQAHARTVQNWYAKEENQIKRKAQTAVYAAIQRGELAPASACQCNDCRNAPAEDLHHHSYEPIHWLDVVPLCRACHIYRHTNPEAFQL